MFTVAGFFHRDLHFLALFLVDCGFIFLGGGEFCFGLVFNVCSYCH